MALHRAGRQPVADEHSKPPGHLHEFLIPIRKKADSSADTKRQSNQ